MKGQEVLFMLKLDGLTTKLIYEDGRLIQASTRGDGEVGKILHTISAFLNVPLTIPHKERLVITGESFIPTNDFERLKDTLRDGNGKPYKNGRNLLPDQYEVLIRRTVSDVVFAFFRSMY